MSRKKIPFARAKQTLWDTFGHSEFRGIQEKAIRRVIEQESTLVLMPTGMGKSLCYQLPSQLFHGLTLVISPLIALMKDQVDAARKLGLNATFINSSLSTEQRKKRYKELSLGKYKLLYVTPERFNKTEFIEAIQKNQVDLLAIDEAHCISEWGHDFRPDYQRIAEFHALLQKPPLLALTATATLEVQADIVASLGQTPQTMPVVQSGVERENLYLAVADVHGLEQKLELIESLRNPEEAMIVYCALVGTLEKLSEGLRKRGIAHLNYHGQLGAKDRRSVQNAFMKEPGHLILATPAFGLGVDKSDIRCVVHAEMPGSLEAYYQEVGRAGRDGAPADCVLLYDEDDLSIQMDFIKWGNPDPSFIRGVFAQIQNHTDAVNAQGYGFIRDKMHFYHSRDFRVETSVKLLQRWDFLEGQIEQKNIKAVGVPQGDFLDKDLVQKRLLSAQKKLLEMVHYFKEKECRKNRIYRYFGLSPQKPCGLCDLCCPPKD